MRSLVCVKRQSGGLEIGGSIPLALTQGMIPLNLGGPMASIKAMVDTGKKVYFSWFRDGNLWYKTECGFEFPVPISDVGTATLKAEDKALLFMRYIRKHVALIESERN